MCFLAGNGAEDNGVISVGVGGESRRDEMGHVMEF